MPEIDQGTLDPASGEVVLHAPWGRFIRDGELAEVCGPFQLRGRVPELLAAVAAVGDDAQAAGAGWCAKGRAAPRGLGDGAVAGPRRRWRSSRRPERERRRR